MFPREPGCYIINHIPTGKFYIGSSNNLYKRHKNHDSYLKRGVHHRAELQSLYDIDDDIHVEYVVTATRDEAYELEQRELDRLLDDPNCLNIGTSARNGWKPGTKVVSEITRQRISDAARNRGPVSDETRRLLSERNKGIPKTEEHKERIRQSSLTRPPRELSACVNRKAIMINGVRFASINEAVDNLPVSRSTITNRLKSDSHPDWVEC